MKILFIAQRIGPATKQFTGQDVKDESWIATFLSELGARFPDIEIVHCFPMEGEWGRDIRIGGIRYYPVRKIGGRVGRWLRRVFSRIENKSLLQSFESVIEEVKPDVIHIFGSEREFGLLQERIKIPVILQIQGLLGEIIPVYSGGVGVSKLFIAAGIRDFLRGGMYFDYKSMKKAAKREIRIFRNVEHVIGTSKFDEDEFRRVNKKADYHHLDLILRKEFYDWNWSRTKSLNLVTISNEYSYKGFDLILKTVEELICRGIQFKWVVIGISPSGSFFKLYKKLFRDSKLWEHVSLPGALSVSEILKHFNEGFLYVNPSYIETGPLSLCEAMMVGMPVITSDAGGAKYLVNNGVDGLIFKTGDHNALAARVSELFNDRELATKLGRNAKKTAMIRHDPVEIIKRYKELLNKFIEI